MEIPFTEKLNHGIIKLKSIAWIKDFGAVFLYKDSPKTLNSRMSHHENLHPCIVNTGQKVILEEKKVFNVHPKQLIAPFKICVCLSKKKKKICNRK